MSSWCGRVLIKAKKYRQAQDRLKLFISSLSQSHQIFLRRPFHLALSTSHCRTVFHPIDIILSFNTSKPSELPNWLDPVLTIRRSLCFFFLFNFIHAAVPFSLPQQWNQDNHHLLICVFCSHVGNFCTHTWTVVKQWTKQKILTSAENSTDRKYSNKQNCHRYLLNTN